MPVPSVLHHEPILSVVSPAFCESAGIRAFVEKIVEVLQPLGLSYEIVLIDDGSSDDTWEHMRREAEHRPNLRCLRLSRNFGKEAALVAGIEAARGRAVITLDCDLQHPPEMIPEMVRLWRSGQADIIEARKDHRQKESAFARLCAGAFYSLFERVTSLNLRNAGDFKLMDRRAVDAWRQLPERRVFFRGMSGWVGFRRAELLFTPAERLSGSSKWSFFAKLILALDSLSAYTAKPLSLIWLLGLLFAVFAVLVGGEALWTKFTGQALTGFTTVILLILITGASILAGICLLSLYVRQIFHEVKGRPRYLVSERTDEPAEARPAPGGPASRRRTHFAARPLKTPRNSRPARRPLVRKPPRA